ncbi:hypothetical protein SAMN05446589_10668 [Streptomyces sp. OV198]|uniref:hypothetical protein n=1 Tax=Streptomyces sp. OV198 TaxID=1882787 RepID=UPI000BCBBCB7|nr:hypothetical protein [Streptomyces sp. OV198]SOF03368.1 hypothetical protein SAMN05446589_10668 [Streptomyces sp. OV198]
MTESVGKTYVVYDAVRYGKLGADHMRFSNDGRSTKKLGSTEAHSFTDEKIGTIVCTGTPYPKKGPVPPRAHPPTVPSKGASCRSGTVTWGASVGRRVIVAASDRRRTPPNIWVTLRLRDVVQLRSRFTTDHNYPRLAQDLVAAYSEKMSQFTYTYTYPCAGSGAAHGTMSVWLPGFGGTLSCISKRSGMGAEEGSGCCRMQSRPAAA